MFIEIDSSLKLTPLLLFNTGNDNIIKKSQIKHYNDAKDLLMSIENRVSDYQKIIEEKTNLLLIEKQSELTEHISNLLLLNEKEMELAQKQWFSDANEKLKSVIEDLENKIAISIEEVKKSAFKAVLTHFEKMKSNEALINFFTDALHYEFNDFEKKLKIIRSEDDSEVVLTIENENSILSINIDELIDKLKLSIENIDNV